MVKFFLGVNGQIHCLPENPTIKHLADRFTDYLQVMQSFGYEDSDIVSASSSLVAFKTESVATVKYRGDKAGMG